MNKISKKKLILLIVALIAIIGLGSLFAYLSDTDQKTNVFTLGSVKITLTEPNWNSSNGQNVVPGQPISKDPRINNTGNNPAYVYIKVVNPIVELANGTTGVLFNYTAKSGWTQLDEQEQCGYKATTYYYNTALNSSATTTTLFDSITINDYSGEINENQVLDIYGYGIQSTYLQSGSTVTSIFTDAFTSSLSDTDEKCNSVLDCSNNEVYTTIPSNLKGLAKIMAKNAYLDNGKSEYVSSCSGVSFNAISSDTNGKGIYEIASTKNDTYPIYYYRGAVDNNNVKFGGFCWKAIRTTDTGGVKLIYNGTPDGSGNCTNTTGAATQIGTNNYNTYNNSPAYAGYMYGTVFSATYKLEAELNNAYVYGNNVTYSGGTYTLTNTMTTTGTWSNDYNTINNNHYTCFSTGTTCTNVYYVYISSSSGIYYLILNNGKKANEALDEMLKGNNVNTTSSTAKTTIDTWYNTNLSSYTSYIEDTVYCNDRSIGELNSWDPNGGSNIDLSFGSRSRTSVNHIPALTCNQSLDRFTVSSTKGNGKLTYPVGLITSDEAAYAGGTSDVGNSSYYLYSNQIYWSSSPSNTGNMYVINNSGKLSYYGINNTYGYRPVISLKATDVVASGAGTATNPYVIRTN